MNTLNLDIDTYSIFDLTHLFSLKSTYTTSEVISGKDKLIHQLKQMDSISSDKKINIHMFIDNASTRLMNDMSDTSGKSLSWAQKENNMVPTSDDHYVIEDANRLAGKHASIAEGRIASSDMVPPGWLNPINIKTIQTGLNIDSRFRKNYSQTNASDFTFELPDIQRKVTNMRIASIDIPMSYYGVSRDRGDATFIITMTEPSESTQPLQTHPCFRSDPSIVVNHLIDTSEPFRPVVFSSDMEKSSFTFGWLVVLPDGNYEMEWQSSSRATDITIAMKNALSKSMPGILLKDTGKFLVYSLTNDTTTGTTDYGINTDIDLTYIVDQTSGKSIFYIPTSSCTSIFNTDGYHIQFATNAGGS